jgi:hypothetical protein
MTYIYLTHILVALFYVIGNAILLCSIWKIIIWIIDGILNYGENEKNVFWKREEK